MKFKIEIDRYGCIACGACYNKNPSAAAHFELDDEGKSTVFGGETDDYGSSGAFKDEEIEKAKSAEDSCPVSIITITEL